MPRKAFSGKQKKEQLQQKRQLQAAMAAARDPDAPLMSKKQVKKEATDAIITQSRAAVRQQGAGGAHPA